MNQWEAMMYAQDPDLYREKLDAQKKQQRGQGALRLGAGAFDFFGGRKAQREADEQIGELSTQAEDIRTQLGEMRAPGSMDPSTVAEATRNAAILGFQSPAEDPSDDLAAQAMALQSGADPSKLYAEATKADQASDAQQRLEAQSQFKEGLGMAQTDALNRYKQDYEQKADELAALEGDIAGLQQESLAAQQRKQRGLQGAITGGTQYLQSGGAEQLKSALDAMKSRLGGKPQEEVTGDTTGTTPTFNQNIEIDPIQQNTETVTPELGFDQGQEVEGLDLPSSSYAFAAGGSVQQTPGEYDHDTNDMILMAQGKDGMLIDTGIRQTGGEFVIDPFDAGNMRQAHEKIDPVRLEKVRQGDEPMDEELAEQLFRMYDAVRFINEPQFDDDYYEKKVSGEFDDRYYEKKMMGHA
jgi:hypothetical protein